MMLFRGRDKGAGRRSLEVLGIEDWTLNFAVISRPSVEVCAKILHLHGVSILRLHDGGLVGSMESGVFDHLHTFVAERRIPWYETL